MLEIKGIGRYEQVNHMKITICKPKFTSLVNLLITQLYKFLQQGANWFYLG